MEARYKITIPKPCQEDWNKMTPDETGRFCNSCSKSVVDFTRMLPDEIQHYFISNQGENICGRFKKSQLDEIIVQIPNQVLLSQVHYHKMFLLALFIAMGTTLFSCKQENGTKQKIDKIEVVEDSSVINNTIVGMRLPSKNDAAHISPPPPKEDQVKFVKPLIKKSIHSKNYRSTIKNSNHSKISTNSTSEQQELYIDNTIYGGIGINAYPEYEGGFAKFNTYIIKNYTFSEKAKKPYGRIAATFEILKDGRLDSINVSKDLGNGTKEELIRVLKNSQKWFPGEEYGKKKECKFELSLVIKPDTIKKSFFRTKIKPKIDTIEIKRITIYKGERF